MNKRDFGSFHSSNVQELISLPEDEYQPPEFPDKLKVHDFSSDNISAEEFGHNIKNKLFLLEEECTFLNHGAFGGTLKQALEASQKWQCHAEKQPLRYFDRELLPHLAYVTRRMAAFVGCRGEDLVLIQNVTTAINSVIQSLNITSGDTIFCLSITYGAVKKLLNHVCKTSGAKLVEAKVSFPIANPQEILDLVRGGVKKGMKIAVFDHIPSNTPFILPVKEIIQICHHQDVPVLIDGAHALGAIHLDLGDLGADYYVTNCHKWFCAPKGSALMYVSREHQKNVRPLIISHGFGSGFNSEFIWAGLRDYSPFLALHTVLDFWQCLGEDNIRQYMYRLTKEACDLLLKQWKSGLLAPKDMLGCMAAVRLPEELYKNCDFVDYSKAEIVQNALYHQYNIEVPIKAVDGDLYVRISAHIYNELSEYSKLAKAVIELQKQQLLLTDNC